MNNLIICINIYIIFVYYKRRKRLLKRSLQLIFKELSRLILSFFYF